MKSIFGSAVAVCMLVAFSAERASADIIYDLVGVNLVFAGNSAGTLTGTFATNDARTQLTAASITASSASVPWPASWWPTNFAATTYTLASATVPSILLPQGILRFDLPSGDQLQLVFTGGLLATGASQVSGVSYEHQDVVANRTVSSGSVVARAPVAAVPEPSPLAVISICVPAALGFALLRRRRLAAAA